MTLAKDTLNASDYAASDARKAIENNKVLEERVTRLEGLVASLMVTSHKIHPDTAARIVKGN